MPSYSMYYLSIVLLYDYDYDSLWIYKYKYLLKYT